MMKTIICLLAAFILLWGHGVVHASDLIPTADGDDAGPWHIDADQISYDRNTDQYVAVGKVVITKADRRLTADFVRFDHKNMHVDAQGNVVMTTEADIIVAERMEMDLETETGILYNGSLFIQATHFYIRGDQIKKTGKDTYEAQRATITSCDSYSPAWKIYSRTLKITVEGYGYATHASLWAKKIPVIYAPLLVFPVKLKRQTGLLSPQIGYSDRKGEEYVQPFFWAINESSDATFYLHHMGRRGEKFGAEYRYVLDDESKGTVMFDYLDDKKIDDGAGDSSLEWGYTSDNTLRPNSDRYWFRMKHDTMLPFGFSAKLDLDVVSDQDYLAEFRSGYNGFDATEDYFNNTFGRQIDDYNDPVRVNRLNLFKAWSNYSLNAELRWYDDVITRRQGTVDSTLQKLPLIEFNGLKQPLMQSSFYFDLDTEYQHFYRDDGNRGHRADIYPRFYLPTRIFKYLSFEPSVGLRETLWVMDEFEDGSNPEERAFSREFYDFKLDASTEISRVFTVEKAGIDRIKHTLRPQVIYSFAPDIDQDEYPSFDGLDRIAKNNSITYSLINTFTARSFTAMSKTIRTPMPIDEDTDVEELPAFTYHQFGRLSLTQSFDINEANKDDGTEERPFSAVSAELEFDPIKYLSLKADAQWNPYEAIFTSHNALVNISDPRGDSLFAEHRYTQFQSETFYGNLHVKLNRRWAAFYEYEYDLLNKTKYKSVIGASYQQQCWSVRAFYTDAVAENDRKYEFMITLYGLGGLGYTYDPLRR